MSTGIDDWFGYKNWNRWLELPVIQMTNPPEHWEDKKVKIQPHTLTERVFSLEDEVAQLRQEVEALRAIVGHDTIPCPALEFATFDQR